MSVVTEEMAVYLRDVGVPQTAKLTYCKDMLLDFVSIEEQQNIDNLLVFASREPFASAFTAEELLDQLVGIPLLILCEQPGEYKVVHPDSQTQLVVNNLADAIGELLIKKKYMENNSVLQQDEADISE